MRRPRQGARRPPAAVHPPAYPTPELIQTARPRLRVMLLGYGVARGDVDDLLQDIAVGAHRSIRAGRFRPTPGEDPARALRRWLVGVLFNLLDHYHRKAYRHREVPMADPWEVVSAPVADDAIAKLEAREALRLLRALPEPYRQVLELAATGHGMSEIAATLRLPVGTPARRMRRARRRLRALLARRPPAPAPRWEPGHRDAIRTRTRAESGVIGGIRHEVVTVTARNLLRIPERVTEDDLDELRDAGFDVSRDVWGEPIAKAPGARWYNPAGYELAKLRFRRAGR